MIETLFTPKEWHSASIDYLHDTKTGRDYAMILGGMAWPSILPGALVVLGQSFHSNPQTRKRDIWILVEKEGNHQAIFEAMDLHGWQWKCRQWYGDGFDEANMQLMHKHNRGKPNASKVRLIDAPFVEEPNSFQAYWNLIAQSASSACKVLQFFGSTYPAKIQDVAGKIESSSIKPQDHPAVVALGYALAALQVYGHGRARWKDVGYVPLDERLGI
jgi:hypothetical protein